MAIVALALFGPISTTDAAENSGRRSAILHAKWLSSLEADPSWSATYEGTEVLWRKLLRSNADLKDREVFFRTYVAAVRLESKLPSFGQAFADQLDETKLAAACQEFLLCSNGIVGGFLISKPPGIFDIVRYTLEATCFGYLPDPDHRFRALELFDAVVGRLGPKVLATNIFASDQHFLRRELADMLATANKDWEEARTQKKFKRLYDLIGHAPGGRKQFSKAQGRDRAELPAKLDAARAACAGR